MSRPMAMRSHSSPCSRAAHQSSKAVAFVSLRSLLCYICTALLAVGRPAVRKRRETAPHPQTAGFACSSCCTASRS